MKTEYSIDELDLLARENPKRFVEYCRIHGITYLDDISDNDKALLYSYRLQNVFGKFSEDMLKALMNYQVEV